MNLILDLSPEALRNAATEVPAPKVTWRKVGTCKYEAKVDGARYQLCKQGGEWYVHKFVKPAARPKGSFIEWDLVKPHAYIQSFGTTLKAAKHNAALFLVRGIGGDSDLWLD